MSGVVLVRVERGEAGDILELIDNAGLVCIVHDHGVDDPERVRTREAELRLLRGMLSTTAAVTQGAAP